MAGYGCAASRPHPNSRYAGITFLSAYFQAMDRTFYALTQSPGDSGRISQPTWEYFLQEIKDRMATFLADAQAQQREALAEVGIPADMVDAALKSPVFQNWASAISHDCVVMLCSGDPYDWRAVERMCRQADGHFAGWKPPRLTQVEALAGLWLALPSSRRKYTAAAELLNRGASRDCDRISDDNVRSALASYGTSTLRRMVLYSRSPVAGLDPAEAYRHLTMLPAYKTSVHWLICDKVCAETCAPGASLLKRLKSHIESGEIFNLRRSAELEAEKYSRSYRECGLAGLECLESGRRAMERYSQKRAKSGRN